MFCLCVHIHDYIILILHTDDNLAGNTTTRYMYMYVQYWVSHYMHIEVYIQREREICQLQVREKLMICE